MLCRLCPRVTEAMNAQRKQVHQPAAKPYSTIKEFVEAVDKWCEKWSAKHNIQDETPEATIMRLSAKLCQDKDILQVNTSLQDYNQMQKDTKSKRMLALDDQLRIK